LRLNPASARVVKYKNRTSNIQHRTLNVEFRRQFARTLAIHLTLTSAGHPSIFYRTFKR
jgi:hypothetical protein